MEVAFIQRKVRKVFVFSLFFVFLKGVVAGNSLLIRTFKGHTDSVNLILFKLPEKRLISSVEGPETTGFGPSFSSASYNGFGKIRKKLKKILEEKIKNL